MANLLCVGPHFTHYPKILRKDGGHNSRMMQILNRDLVDGVRTTN